MDDSVSSGLAAIDSTNLVRDWLAHFSNHIIGGSSVIPVLRAAVRRTLQNV
jgi:hypothetical protein